MFKELTYTYVDLSTNLTLNCFCDPININRLDGNSFDCDIHHAVIKSLNLETNNDIKKSLNVDLSKDFLNTSLYLGFNELYPIPAGVQDIKTPDNTPNSTVYSIPEYSESNTDKIYNKVYWFQKNRNSGYQYLLYAPFYIESKEDLPYKYVIKVTIKNSRKNTTNITKYLYIDITSTQKLLYQYLYRYAAQQEFLNSSIYLKSINRKEDVGKTKVSYTLNYDIRGINLYNGVLSSFNRNREITYTNNHTIDLSSKNPFQDLCQDVGPIIIHQIIPLAFSFNIDSLLTENEKLYFKNSQIEIHGYYIDKNGIQYDKYQLKKNLKYFLFNENENEYNNYLTNIQNNRNSYLFDGNIKTITQLQSGGFITIDLDKLKSTNAYSEFIKRYNFLNGIGKIYDNGLSSINNILINHRQLLDKYNQIQQQNSDDILTFENTNININNLQINFIDS